jgi:hypothetical protein
MGRATAELYLSREWQVIAIDIAANQALHPPTYIGLSLMSVIAVI